MRLILFDIDGTLLTCGRQAAPLFYSTLIEVYGTAGPVDGYDFGGKTDPQIVYELMSAAGLSTDAIGTGLPHVRDLYLDRLDEKLHADGMRLLPGVGETLERLAGRDDVTLGLLTGNWERGARIKLSRFELNHYFPFGGFGDDGIARHELVPAALDRAARSTGRHFAPHEALIVGDTVHDISCAQAHGVPVLAVATGHTQVSVLEAAGANWVAADLHHAARIEIF